MCRRSATEKQRVIPGQWLIKENKEEAEERGALTELFSSEASWIWAAFRRPPNMTFMLAKVVVRI